VKEQERSAREGFRNWIADRLQGTDFVSRQLKDSEVDALAKGIGVQPDVLLAARVKWELTRATEGAAQRLGKKVAGSKHYQLEVRFPEEIHKEWAGFAASRNVGGSVLLRSIVHAYLRGTYEPPQLVKYWHWRGKRWPFSYRTYEQKEKKKWPWRERALITIGARRAMKIRSQLRGSGIETMARALILASMAGKFAQRGQLELVDSASMFDDETRYYLGAAAR
jgi:hypothetical protein